jgi:hypothetical protein
MDARPSLLVRQRQDQVLVWGAERSVRRWARQGVGRPKRTNQLRAPDSQERLRPE